MLELDSVADTDGSKNPMFQKTLKKAVVVTPATAYSVTGPVKTPARNDYHGVGQIIHHRCICRGLEKPERMPFQQTRDGYKAVHGQLVPRNPRYGDALSLPGGHTKYRLQVNFVVHCHVSDNDVGIIPIG
jgi:hypothetical protein